MSESVLQEFEKARPRLKAIAYRMLGSAAEAEDAVQEVWIRLSRTEPAGIDNLGGWLTTVVSRVCIDQLRSSRARPEEPVADPEATTFSSLADAEESDDELLLADSIGPALVVVLDSLDPYERLAFVLHDLFGVPFAEIAPIVGRSTGATRQLASRARRRLRGRSEEDAKRGTSGEPARSQQKELVEAFLSASRDGDFEALLALLDPDVVVRADAVAVRMADARRGQGAPRIRDEIRGRQAVAGVFSGQAAAARAAVIDGVPGAVWATAGRTRAAFLMRWSEGRIVQIEIVADPRHIEELEIVL